MSNTKTSELILIAAESNVNDCNQTGYAGCRLFGTIDGYRLASAVDSIE